MSLKILPIAENLQESVSRQTIDILAHKLLPGPGAVGPIRLSACFELYRMDLNRRAAISAGTPDGIRALLSSDRQVIAALDFYFNAEGDLRFTHAFTGRYLAELVEGLNALVSRYREREKTYRVACINFHYAAYPYFLVWSGKRPAVFSHHLNTLTLIRAKQFRAQLGSLGSKRPTTLSLKSS
jgi:hypothetical protein